MNSWKTPICIVAVAASAAFLGCEDDVVPLPPVVPPPPIANPDTAVTNEDVPVVIPVLANDDAAGGVLTLMTVTEPANGTVTIELDGTLTYTPAADFSGSDSFGYTVVDGRGVSATATVTITVTGVNDPPSFSLGSDVTVDEDCGPQTVGGWATDISAGPGESGQTLTFNVTVESNPALFLVAPEIDPGTGDLTFTPADNAYGSADITVSLSDNGGGSDTSAPWASTIYVAAVNDPPSFTAGTDVTVGEDCGTQAVGGWATDISVGPGESGQTLTFNVTVESNPALFSAAPEIDAATGDLTFTPADDAFGSADITVTLSDDAGGTDTSAPAAFTITVTASDDAPVGVDDVANVEKNQSVDIAVLGNDIDPDLGSLLVSAVTVPANGTASVNPDDTIAYQPDTDFSGVDSFEYTVSDRTGGSDTARVWVGVCELLNSPPSAVDDVAATDTDTPIRTLAVLANDSDPNWDTLSIHSFTQPAAGVVTLNDDGTLFYTPPNTGGDLEDGTDSFTYVVHDGRGGVAMGAVSISVAVVTGPIEDRKAALIEKCHGQMFQIGVALRRYRDDQSGEPYFPLWLSDLVTLGYLPSAKLLACPLDASGGSEGGKPPVSMQQFQELDEGSSYMYEFNMAADCSWNWQSFLFDYMGVSAPAEPDAFVNLDGDPMSSKWGEVKQTQLTCGDSFLNADPPGSGNYLPEPEWHGYPPDMFPVLRCFWHADDPDTGTEKAISNLSFGCTIFLSTAMWERDVVE